MRTFVDKRVFESHEKLDEMQSLEDLAKQTSFPSLVSTMSNHTKESGLTTHGAAHDVGSMLAGGANGAAEDLAAYLSGSIAARPLDGHDVAVVTSDDLGDSAPSKCSESVPLAAAALVRSLTLDDLEDVAAAILPDLERALIQ